MSRYWPLADLRVCTERLELRLPTAADLDALGDLAADGVHDPDESPFIVTWTDLPPAERATSVVQHHWRTLGAWTPDRWMLPLVVVEDGTVVATQGMGGRDFAVTREVFSGSWVGRRYHGRGIGTEMRAAVLHLAFEGLGARYARSGALDGNGASLRVSAKNGYRPNGELRQAVRGRARTEYRVRLDRETWAANRRCEVTIEGLGPCRPLFGLAPEAP